MKTVTLGICAAILSLCLGCSAKLSEHAQKSPGLDLFSYFEGPVAAWGMVQDRAGNQTRRFEVDLVGTIDGNTLVLAEDFRFDDGELSQRTWTIERLAEGQYRGTAPDVVGEAFGEVQGNALRWRYTLRVPVDDTTYDIKFDDWMFLQDERRMFNLATMSKLGFEVGRITLFFEKLESGR